MDSLFDSIMSGLDEAIDDARQKRNLQKTILSSDSHKKESCRSSEFRLVFSEHSQYDEQNRIYYFKPMKRI